MALLTLLSTSAASANGSVFDVRGNLSDADTGVLQVSIETSGTVTVEGRLSAVYPWASIHSVTASGAAEVPLLPQMRATLTGGSGAIRAGLYVPMGG